MNFRVGQEVVCIKGADEEWFCPQGESVDGPRRGEVLVIDKIEDGYLSFVKYTLDESFNPAAFIPAIRPQARSVAQDLKNRFPMVEERTDCPAKTGVTI